MKIHQLWFADAYKVEIREQELNSLKPGHVLIKTLYSAISAGTELLLYRGQIPETLILDDSLTSYKDVNVSFPLQYGYSCVGVIEEVGENVDVSLLKRKVFTFQPHASYNACAIDQVIILPNDIDPLAAVFLANMETAVNLVHDGNPHLGDRSIVIGQGIIGLLTTSLLSHFPLAGLYTLENVKMRRAMSKGLGINESFSPKSNQDVSNLKKAIGIETTRDGADIVFELSGSPSALDLAVELTAYSGRVIVGSWYGSKRAEMNLGERFHRNRISIVSSQVSSISPKFSGRWDKARRYSQAWRMINKCQPEQFITHRIPFHSASEAYRLLDECPDEAVQVIFDY